MQGEDLSSPCDWRYRGEGAANIVLAYHGSSPLFVGKVLRLQKLPSSSPPPPPPPGPVLSPQELILWSHCPPVATATSEEILTQAYARDVLRPLLGHSYIDPGTLVHASKTFLEAVEKGIHEERPDRRRKCSRIDTRTKDALLIADHSRFPIARGVERSLPPAISVEIKPKCGFLPASALIAEENSVKRRVSRFAMHQYLKLSQGMIETLSDYSPLDLFSGSHEKMYHAVQALFETPQNNLRVFVDGGLVFGTSIGASDRKKESFAFHDLNHALEKAMPCSKDKGVEVLQKIIVDVLVKTKALSLLLAVQMLDLYDIEGVIHAYNKIIQRHNDIAHADKQPEEKEADGFEMNEITKWMNSLTLEDTRKVVRDYLIAATAKDCSIMLTLQSLPTGINMDTALDDYTMIACPENNQNFRCKVNFLDLDLKRLKKIPYYLKLDQEIVKCYLRRLTMEPSRTSPLL